MALDPAADLEQGIARAKRQRLITLRGLTEYVEATLGHPGAPRVGELLGLHGGPKFTRSEVEREALRLLRAAGLPEPDETNERPHGEEVDCVWHTPRVVLEIDSKGFHTDDLAFHRDHELDAKAQLAGYLVVRTTWHEVMQRAPRFVARMAMALAPTASAA